MTAIQPPQTSQCVHNGVVKLHVLASVTVRDPHVGGSRVITIERDGASNRVELSAEEAAHIARLLTESAA